MVLSVRGFALSADDGAADAHGGLCAAKVEVADSDGEHFPDAYRGPEEHFDDLSELPVWSRPGGHGAFFPFVDGVSDLPDFGVLENVGASCGALQPRDVIHRIARDDLVADGESEGEAEHDSGLPGATVALPGELLDEVVASCDSDLSERELGERGRDEGAHVSFVEQPSRAGESVFDLHVFEPVVDECGEGAVGGDPDERGLEEGPFGELPFECEFGGGGGWPGALDRSELAIPVAVPRPRLASPLAYSAVTDLPERADGSSGPSHVAPPHRESRTGENWVLMVCAVDFRASDQTGSTVTADGQYSDPRWGMQ